MQVSLFLFCLMISSATIYLAQECLLAIPEELVRLEIGQGKTANLCCRTESEISLVSEAF